MTDNLQDNAPRLCKTCKWFGPRWFGPNECRHPVIGPREPVADPETGKVDARPFKYCGVNRMHIHNSDGGCGFVGNLWEPK